MAKIYYRKILSGDMTLDDVPQRWREEVEELVNCTEALHIIYQRSE